MSTTVSIRTKRKIKLIDVAKALADDGMNLVVSCNDDERLQFGEKDASVRGIELFAEEDGYTVRACLLSSKADYRLFRLAAAKLAAMTGGKLLDEDDEPLASPDERFDEAWAERQRLSGLNVVRAMINSQGGIITIYGLFAPCCIGPWLLKDQQIAPQGELTGNDADRFEGYLLMMQNALANARPTNTKLCLAHKDDPERRKDISLISISDGEPDRFDYIEGAALLGIIDRDADETALIPMKQAWKVLTPGKFMRLDDCQFLRTEELTADDVRLMLCEAKAFEPDDQFAKPAWPGFGLDEGQRTFVMMWNPAISNVKLKTWAAQVPDMLTEPFSWSVAEYDKVRIGDRFFLVRCGEGRTGIVMAGLIDSKPYGGEDWSGRGRTTLYVDLSPSLMLDPEQAPMISTAELQRAIPSFNWEGGHSGRLLGEEEAQALEALWAKFVKKQSCEKCDPKVLNLTYLH